jgi:DNA mismatch repair protein MutS
MAGMPPSLIDRANEILKQLEESGRGAQSDLNAETGHTNTVQAASSVPTGESIKKLTIPQMQLSIFDAHSQTFEDIRKMLTDMDINRLTPVEALMKLNEIKGLLK